jgi:hypothetical protein
MIPRRPLLAAVMVLAGGPAGLGGLGGCGAAQKPSPAPAAEQRAEPVCTYPTQVVGASGETHDLPAMTWLAFLLPGLKVETGEVTRPVVNCTGQVARWSYEGPECPALELNRSYLPAPTGISPRDLVSANASQYTRLVWAVTDRLSDGEAEGPIALAEFHARSIDIRAVGTLRALPERAHLRLVTVQGQPVLVAEGEQCESDAGGRCFRGTRLMLLVGSRFEPQPLRLEDGHCLEPAFFPTEHTEVVTGKDGTRRAMTANSRLDFAADGISVHEEIAVRSTDPGNPGAPGRLLREARADRRLMVRSGRLYVSDGALWERMIQEW